MSENDEILTVEKETEHAIKMGKALIVLRSIPEFITLIEEGYLKEKVLASVSLLAVPQIKAQNRRPDVMEDIVAASNLQYFFQMIENAYLEATDPVYSEAEEEEMNGD